MIKNLIILAVVLGLSYILSVPAGELYDELIAPIGGWVNFAPVVGIPLAFIFFLTLLFTALGGRHKYWWIGILLIPAAVFELYFDLAHIYFPIALGLVGWLLGLGIGRLVHNIK